MNPTVWRLRWEMNGVEHFTEWSIHFDHLRRLREDYRRDWPGAGVEVERATVAEVNEPVEMSFGGSA